MVQTLCHDALSSRFSPQYTAIDGFSRVGYAIPIRGTLNSKKAFEALKKILAEAKKRYGTDVKRIQTDKGSEFTHQWLGRHSGGLGHSKD